MVTERALLTSALREVEEDVVVVVVTEEEECGVATFCPGGRGSEAEAVMVVSDGVLSGALLSVNPPPFCDGLCLTTFNSSIWVSAVP